MELLALAEQELDFSPLPGGNQNTLRAPLAVAAGPENMSESWSLEQVVTSIRFKFSNGVAASGVLNANGTIFNTTGQVVYVFCEALVSGAAASIYVEPGGSSTGEYLVMQLLNGQGGWVALQPGDAMPVVFGSAGTVSWQMYLAVTPPVVNLAILLAPLGIPVWLWSSEVGAFPPPLNGLTGATPGGNSPITVAQQFFWPAELKVGNTLEIAATIQNPSPVQISAGVLYLNELPGAGIGYESSLNS